MKQQVFASEIGDASRRGFLGGIVSAPFAGTAFINSRLVALQFASTGEALTLSRTKEGRGLSRLRYRTAESFFASVEQNIIGQGRDELYQVGIALQLALSAHLLDVGFDDAWCARNLGLDVAKSLACANATGLGYDSPDLKKLCDFLSPYSKWRNARPKDLASACPYSCQEVRELTRALLDRVREVTGHPRPRGWQLRAS